MNRLKPKSTSPRVSKRRIRQSDPMLSLLGHKAINTWGTAVRHSLQISYLRTLYRRVCRTTLFPALSVCCTFARSFSARLCAAKYFCHAIVVTRDNECFLFRIKRVSCCVILVPTRHTAVPPSSSLTACLLTERPVSCQYFVLMRSLLSLLTAATWCHASYWSTRNACIKRHSK